MAREEPEQPPGSPDDDPNRSAEPRLSILHLLGAMTSVAVYFGLVETIRLIAVQSGYPPDPSTVLRVSPVLYGLGRGLALGGLLLWFARRRRAVPFPRYPGEYMLLVQATICLLFLARGCLACSLSVISEQGRPVLSLALYSTMMSHVTDLIRALIWTVAGLRIRMRRWRTLFFLYAAATLLVGLLTCGGIARLGAAFCVPELLVTIVLVVIVVRDHRQGTRYPWSHWLGVAICFWVALLNLGFVLEIFFRHWLRTAL